jgi:hypothetical protein
MILSTDLYNIFMNPLSDRLEASGLGLKIGNISVSNTACADDIALPTLCTTTTKKKVREKSTKKKYGKKSTTTKLRDKNTGGKVREQS